MLGSAEEMPGRRKKESDLLGFVVHAERFKCLFQRLFCSVRISRRRWHQEPHEVRPLYQMADKTDRFCGGLFGLLPIAQSVINYGFGTQPL